MFEEFDKIQRENAEGNTCRTCKYCAKSNLLTNHYYYYCHVLRSKRTRSKMMRVKLKDRACVNYKEKKK